MLARLLSLRVRLLAAMLAVACLGLGGSYLLVASIRHANELAAEREHAAEVAQVIAATASTATPAEIAELQRRLPNDRIEVYRGGRLVFSGPPNPRELELTVKAGFPGGHVVVEDHAAVQPIGITPLQTTAILGGVVLLVIGAALGVTTLVVRALRGPIERATEASRRVAAGDLGARIGAVSADEFAELGRTFDDMASRLEASDRMERRFLADVAHEIATPVNAIRGYAEALGDGTIADDAGRDEALRAVAAQGERLDALLHDLRELTRLDLAATVRRERIDLCGLCRDVVARFRPQAAAAGVAIELTAPRRPVERECDRRLLETVLDNFVSNAIRYTPAGGRVELGLRHDRREDTIAVRDTGIGIAPEHRHRVFDRLYRVDEARDRASGGSGLGLAIAQRAARALGGRIELDSEPGQGSEFRLVLPATLYLDK